MAGLSIRTRVAIWYGTLIVAVLLLLAVAMSIVHDRGGVDRIDGGLFSAMRTLDGVVINELREELYLPEAARGALTELELSGVGLAILDHSQHVLAVRTSDIAPVTPAQMALE